MLMSVLVLLLGSFLLSQGPRELACYANRQHFQECETLPWVMGSIAPAAAQQHDIWSSGPILDAVQTAELFNDSKTFVDMPLLVSPDVAVSRFNALPKGPGGDISRKDLDGYVNSTFGKAGSDLVPANPPDFEPEPAGFLANVTDPAIRRWALDIHALWNFLARRESPEVYAQPERHSLLPLESWVVVPGERFREVYYWDSYWVVRGLLVSGMDETATSVVENLIGLLKQYGHVPNGARSYYLNRSQPPLLSQMVAAVYNATGNTTLLIYALEALQIEHEYWTSPPKLVKVSGPNGEVFELSRYYAEWDMPRPESYREDVATAEGLTPEEKSELWRNIATGAESGWDFSTRWFADGMNLDTIQTTRIVPADLNAYLYQMENNVANFAEELGMSDVAKEYRGYADARRRAMNIRLYDPAQARWNDLIINDTDSSGISRVSPNNGTFVSNYIPLWAGVAEPGSSQAADVTKSLLNSGLIQAAGVATSLTDSGQQWDEPNAWPPLQHMVIEALQQYGGPEGEAAAANIAQRWLASNLEGYRQLGGKMVEKYSATSPGVAGGGGEYNVQTGFGWTNGVVLALLQDFGWQPQAAATPVGAPMTAPAAGVQSGG